MTTRSETMDQGYGYARLDRLTLLGNLLMGTMSPNQVERELAKMVADEKTRSYSLGVADAKAGRWGR